MEPTGGMPSMEPRAAALWWHGQAVDHDARGTAARRNRDAAIAEWKQTATLAEIAAALDISDAAVHHAIARHNRANT
jgi:hypothetical protein